MSTKSVLDRIYDIKDEMNNSRHGAPSMAQFHDEIRRQLVGQSVIANYAIKRTYIIHDITFDLGPCNTFFDLRDGQKISVAKYFYKTYNMKITDKRQPMLIVKNQGHHASIPSEFCMVDGVPDQIRSNPMAMRNLLNKVKQNPQEKLESIKGMINNLIKKSTKLKEYDITLDTTP